MTGLFFCVSRGEQVASMEKVTPAVSDVAVGVGGTASWRAVALLRETTLGVYFDVAAAGKEGGGPAQQGGPGAGQQQQQFFIQFVTTYCDARGQWRLRSTTITRRWTDGGNLAELAMGFDQEAAAVLVARQCNWKMETARAGPAPPKSHSQRPPSAQPRAQRPLPCRCARQQHDECRRDARSPSQ